MQLPILYKSSLYILFCTILFIPPVKAQYEATDFVRYTVKDGLSDNYITSLQQDDQGYLWIGTDAGLNRFDGNSFKKFYQGSVTLPLLSGAIRKLKVFSPNHLAILSIGGFQLLDTKDYSLHNYYIPDSTAFSTQRNIASDAVQLPDQSFAVATFAGFYVFNKSGAVDFRQDAYSLDDVGKKRILYGRDIFPINEKECLVYVEENSLASYNTARKTFAQINRGQKEWNVFFPPASAKEDHWNVKYQLNDHQFFFISYRRDSIIFYDRSLNRSVVSSLPFHSSFEFNWQSKIVPLNDTVFAINGGTYGFYLFHFNRQTGKITFDGKKQLPSYKIISLFFDKEKRLWAGTNEGLLKQKLNIPFIMSSRYSSMDGETLTGGFTSIYRYKNKLYAGRYSLNKGLVIIDTARMQAIKEIEFFGGNNAWTEILSVEMYHPDTLWLGTNAGLLWFDTKTEHYGKVLDGKKVPVMTELPVTLAPANKDGYAWMCGHLQGVVIRYHIASRTFTFFTSQTQPALPFDKVKSIAYDSYGDVWIAGHSLARWNTKRQLFDTLITIYGGANKFYDDILTISGDMGGSLWLHNSYNDLLEYRIREKRFISYTAKDGLPSDEIASFSNIIDNTLWIGSNSHLARFDTKSKKAILYDESDGLPEHKPTGRRIYFDEETGALYLCSNDYLAKFPFRVQTNPDNSSGLVMQELMVNNKTSFLRPPDELQLKYRENAVAINFTVIDFEKSSYQFSYRLNNSDDWNTLGNQRLLNLNNLSPGKYSVQLKATGKSANEKVKSFLLVIQPPFWKTPWFFAICSLVLSGIVYYLYRTRIKQVRQKANIDKLLAQTEMKALHSQMNPHFIFNSLNSIREMILNNENKEASHYLSKFAQMIRMTLDQSGQSFISLRNTIDYLQRYIEMEKIRNGHFTWSMNVDKRLDMDETVLPPMLIQPFIENAIWHGVTGNRKNIDIQINFKKENGHLVCTVDDNGIGIEQSIRNKNNNDSLHNPFGITNVQNRIRLLNEKHNLRSAVTVNDKKNLPGSAETGTLVALHLPLEINEE
ncbi:MAG: histidine kinase [Chitinophagales bacterium]